MKLTRVGDAALGSAITLAVLLPLATVMVARAQPGRTMVATTASVVADTRKPVQLVRPLSIPVLASLPPLCTLGDEVLLNTPSGAFALDVCLVDKQRGVCVRKETVQTSACTATKEACLAIAGATLTPEADKLCAVMASWSGKGLFACSVPTTQCVEYQQLYVAQWQEVWVSH